MYKRNIYTKKNKAIFCKRAYYYPDNANIQEAIKNNALVKLEAVDGSHSRYTIPFYYDEKTKTAFFKSPNAKANAEQKYNNKYLYFMFGIVSELLESAKKDGDSFSVSITKEKYKKYVGTLKDARAFMKL